MAEELTPSKGNDAEKDAGVSKHMSGRGESKGSGGGAEEGREEILRELAKACKRQGNFHLACKKYTQVNQ